MDRYVTSLVGCATGDSLGMPIEGWKKEQIKKYVGRIDRLLEPVLVQDENNNLIKQDEFGKIKYWTKDFKKGEYTDDTILTLVIAESLINKKGINIFDIAKRHVELYRKDSKGFGGTTRQALDNLIKGISPFGSGVIGGPGNAPAMKMSPIGFWMHATNKYDQGLEFAQQIGKITHLDPRNLVSGVVQAHAIYSLLTNVRRDEFINQLIGVCKEWERSLTEEFTWHKSGTLLSRLNWTKKHSKAINSTAHKNIGSSSAVYQSFPFALFMFQKYWDDPERGLVELVNYGGDCNTTGAIYGSLVGARGIEFSFSKELKNFTYLSEVGEKFYAAFAKKVQ